jgi:eukaryotic-like serine/threonine-protein kinase
VAASRNDERRQSVTPERWQQVKQVLAAALELNLEERAAYLDRSYAADTALRDDLEPLLSSSRHLGDEFLGAEDLAASARVLEAEEMCWVGRRVGHYKVGEQIGAGGMGEVYRAFRDDDQYRKEVALKFVRAGQFGSSVFARFKNERQILAGLDHPNLAKLLDGGATGEGVPYLVMELIEGQPILEYCASRDLPIRQRLQLFLQVCSGVHYAHQHLVIHRDIKPQNILVTTDGIPKLLDFGIAKIVAPGSEDSNLDRTLTGFRPLTPRYASPEQIKGESMTTATDVYSLGVVLYELLTGLSPYDLHVDSAQDLSRVICEKEVTKPSLSVIRTQRPFRSPAFSEVSPAKLRKQLSGDLDNIVLMALRKEPSRRYVSVNDLQEDIRRHLEKLPVIARNDSAWYRASKFVARHKAGVAATAAVALILVAGIVITMREARIAQQRFNDVRALANSLIFDVHDSVKDLPGSTPARKIIVDRALQYLNVLAHDSAGDVNLQRELATAYERVGAVQGDYLENNLGDFEGTLASYRKVLELRQQIAGKSRDWNDRLALARAYRLVAHQLWANGDSRAARDVIGRAIAVSEVINREQVNNVIFLRELGFDYEVSGRIGYPEDAAENQKRIADYHRGLALDEIRARIQPNDISILADYGSDLHDIGERLEQLDPMEALGNYRKSLEIDLKLTQLSSDPRRRRAVAIDYGDIASVYDDMGDYPQALENNTKDLEIYKDMVAADPKNALLQQGLAISYMNTANSCSRAGQIVKALDYSSRSLEIMRPLVSSGPQNSFQHRVYAAMLVIRGIILTAANQPEAAKTEIEHGRSIYESLYKAGTVNQVNVAASDVKLGEVMAKAGHDQDAANDFRQALTIVEPMISNQAANLDALYAAADAYSGLGDLGAKSARHSGLPAEKRKARWTEARSWYLQSQNTWRRIDHPNHSAPNSFQVGDPIAVAKELKLAETALALPY